MASSSTQATHTISNPPGLFEVWILKRHSLYPWILWDSISNDNEDQPNQSRAIMLKSWSQCHTPYPILMGKGEPWHMIHVPFCTDVNLTEIHITTNNRNAFPEKMLLYINKKNLKPSNVHKTQPAQMITLGPSAQCQVVQLNENKFKKVRLVTVYLPKNELYAHHEQMWLTYLSFVGGPVDPNATVAPIPELPVFDLATGIATYPPEGTKVALFTLPDGWRSLDQQPRQYYIDNVQEFLEVSSLNEASGSSVSRTDEADDEGKPTSGKGKKAAHGKKK